jgi:secreted PhoX family phosphatase
MHDDDSVSNSSGNRPFSDVLQTNLERRRFLQGSTAVATATVLGSWGGTALANGAKGKWGRYRKLLGFKPVTLAQGGGIDPMISPDYEYDVILPWGDPLEPGGPEFSLPVDPQAQTHQVGIGHDGMWFFPVIDGRGRRCGWDDNLDELDPWLGPRMRRLQSSHGVLCLNNEFGTNYHVLRKNVPESLDEVRASQHAHGVTIVELKRRSRGGKGPWETVKSDLARRIHVNTPVTFSGPAAGHPDLANAAGNVALGTVNNCAMGYTPWGTYLTCEENFNGYFGTEDPDWKPTPRQVRYGINSGGFGYYWHLFDKRFDLAETDYANEHNRFGWVVEIDPFDPTQTPVKRTALGRKKNEGAITHVADDGRVVVYNGDDERFDYVYKFVSAEPWKAMRAKGESPLDRGTLYVARFNDDGTGDWLELSLDNSDIAASGEFADIGELLINVRLAADIAGATPMDRPEWATVGPDGQVYMAMTNNSRRDNTGPKTINGRTVNSGPDAANPLAPNNDGHIVRWREIHGHSGTRFTWDIFVFAKDTHGTEASFADPDGMWADSEGRLFIQTDGGQKDGLNNQMVVADTFTGEIKRMFTGVPGCEITGVTPTPDRRTLFINVQHPGDGDPDVSNFPKLGGPDGGTVPRDCTIVITRKDGGVIGS